MHDHDSHKSQNSKSIYKAHNLPHVFNSEKPVFISYRLKFTLPQQVLDEFEKRKKQWLQDKDTTSSQVYQVTPARQDGLRFAWYDELLAKSAEVPKFLHRKDITEVIASSFQHFDGIRYRLLAYCIMPNHVHVLIIPLRDSEGNDFQVARITYGWKRYTANQINKLIGRKGSLWQKESYDHLVRNEKELMNILNYIIQNPVKAGLVSSWQNWPGTWVSEDF